MSHKPQDVGTLKGLDAVRGQIFPLELLEKSYLYYLDSHYNETYVGSLTSRTVRH